MRHHLMISILLWLGFQGLAAVRPSHAREFLTDREIELIQDARAIDARVRIYMEAAAARLQTAEERLSGKESEAGDPMEFHSPEDMLEAYGQILGSVMLNVEDAFQNPRRKNNANVGKALQTLKAATARALRTLAVLKRLAEAKKMEALWNQVHEAIDITTAAGEGAEEGLARLRSRESNR